MVVFWELAKGPEKLSNGERPRRGAWDRDLICSVGMDRGTGRSIARAGLRDRCVLLGLHVHRGRDRGGDDDGDVCDWAQHYGLSA